jgi:hypothetical protein
VVKRSGLLNRRESYVGSIPTSSTKHYGVPKWFRRISHKDLGSVQLRWTLPNRLSRVISTLVNSINNFARFAIETIMKRLKHDKLYFYKRKC